MRTARHFLLAAHSMAPNATTSCLAAQARKLVEDLREFAVHCTPNLRTKDEHFVHFEPWGRGIWAADASLPMHGLTNQPCTVSEAQVLEICASVMPSAFRVVDIDAINDIEDPDYVPSSSEDESDASDCGSSEFE